MGIKRLPKPDVPAMENSEIRLFELDNKLKVLIISSSPQPNSDPDWAVKFPQRNSSNPFEYFSTYRLPHPNSFSDSSSKAHQCAISFCIKAGSLNNPPAFQGLAHFAEHLVHHGSKHFPGEHDVDKFISGQNGVVSATTHPMITNYRCTLDSSAENIHKACRIYASMLSEPLIPLDSVKREIESLDNEYFGHKANDAGRTYNLIHETSISNDSTSPLLNFFECGSKHSLMPKIPHSAQRLREATLKFINTHYFAQNMSAVIMAPLDVDILEKIAIETLSDIPQKSRFPNDVRSVRKNTKIPYEPRLLSRLYTMKPLSHDGHYAEIWKNYKSKTLSYIKYLFSQNGPGSLQHYLKEKKWIYYSFFSKCGFSSELFGNDFCTYFRLIYELTLEGRNNVDEVLFAIFSFINLHRRAGPRRDIFKEMLKVESFFNKNYTLNKTVTSIKNYCSQMLLLDPSDAILGLKSMRSEFRPDLIQYCLDKMIPQLTNFHLITHLHGPTDEFITSEIYGAKYRIQNITEEMKNKMSTMKPYPEFKINLTPNPYLANKSHLKYAEVGAKPETFSFGNFVSLSFEPKSLMKSQQINLSLIFYNFVPTSISKFYEPAFAIWCALIELECENKLHFQSQLGLNWHVVTNRYYFYIYLTGLRPGFFDAVNILLDSFNNSQFSKEEFEMASDFVLNKYHDSLDSNFNATYDLLFQLCYSDHVTKFEHYENMKALTYDEFLKIVGHFKKSYAIDAKLKGCASRAEAENLANSLNSLKSEPSWIELFQYWNNSTGYPRTFVPRGELCLRIKSVNPESKMFLVTNYYEMSQCDTESCYMTDLIAKLMDKAFFIECRIKEQLGYSIFAFDSWDESRTGILLCALAHGEKHSPCYINWRIEEFLKKFYDEYFTPEVVKGHLEKDQIILRDAEYVRRFYSKFLLKNASESEYKKLSIQILGDLGAKSYECLCDLKKYENIEAICKKSKWLEHATLIGKSNKEIAFGGSLENEKSDGSKFKYFITSISDYHKSNL